MSRILTSLRTSTVWAGLLATLMGTTYLVHGQIAPADLRSLVARSTTNASKNLGLFVDPLVVNSLTGDVAIYYSTFCGAPGSSCAFSAENPAVLNAAIQRFLRDYTASQPSEVRRVASHIAGEGQLPRGGYPENAQVSFALVDFGGLQNGGEILIRRLPAPVVVERWATWLLTVPGVVEIGVRNGESIAWRTLSLRPNSRTTLASVPASTSNVALGNLLQHADSLCVDEPIKRYEGALAMFNWGRALRDVNEKQRYENLVKFARSSAVDLAINIDASIVCDSNCRRDISAIFAEAFAAWKGGCARCDQNAFAFIRAADNIWISDKLASRLRALENSGENVQLDLQKDTMGNVVRADGGTSFVTQLAYSNITLDKKMRDQICAMPASKAPWLRGAQLLTCNKGSGAGADDDVVLASLNVMNGATSCGSIAVACGLPGSNVEVNGATYSYKIPRTNERGGEYRLGRASQMLELRAVVLHEVGHWFGVPHSDVAASLAVNDIMSPNYGDGPSCISMNSAVMVNNAADQRWSYRIREGGALNPPRKPTRAPPVETRPTTQPTSNR